MTKTQFRLGVLVIFAAILLHNLTSPDRYSIADGMKLDGVTGKTWKYQSLSGQGQGPDLQWIER